MSVAGGRAGVPATWPELPVIAEGVEELLGVRIFETMIQNPGRC